MPFKVAIRKEETGEVRVHEDSGFWGEGSDWYWTEGNMGCDCNRELLFEQATGQKANLDDVECGHGRFEIVYVELPDGTRITEFQ